MSSRFGNNEDVEELNPSQSGLLRRKCTSIHDLPHEMIEAILTKLTYNSDILNSRLVNRKWKEFSSLIWSRRRKDKIIRFSNLRGRFLCNDRNYRSLNDLSDCFEGGELPYILFDFGDLSYFGNDDIVSFLSTRGKELLGLKITMFDPINSIETLRKLLTEQAPNLKELDIQFSKQKCTSIQLFADFKEFQLPNLEILAVNENFTKFDKITKQILTAACNLKQLNLMDYITANDLQVFQSLNKLHLLKKIQIYLSDDLIDWLKPLIISNLKLQTLYLSFGYITGYNNRKLDITTVVNQLLESSKDVIETLELQPVGWLPDLVFPTLKKLQKLDLWSFPNTKSSSMFPQQIKMAAVFSNLKELDIHFDNFPSTEQLVPMLSVKILRIYGRSSSASREKLTKMTPNVKTLYLNDYNYIWNSVNVTFIDGFRVILNNLTKLETFQWTISQRCYDELFFSLDAVMTGLTKTFCRQISEKLRMKDYFTASELASIEPQRTHSSILDLKELKTLDIKLHFQTDSFKCPAINNGPTCWHDGGGYTQTSKFYRTGFTKISQLLAFDRMPNLNIVIERVKTV